MPANTPVRVRSIHAQNRACDHGHAGQRCALNIVGVEKSAISRGDWLADSRLFAPTTRVDVRLRLTAPGRGLAAWSPIHVHLGTAHRVAHVVPLESERLSPNESARVQLVFDAPVCTLPGDRFIARDAQAAHTIGGGRVLDPFAPSRRRRSAARLRYLDAIEQMIAGDGIGPLLRDAPFGVRMADLVRLTGRAADRISLPSDAVVISAGHERFLILAAYWSALRERAVAALRGFHASAPDEPGPDAGRLRRTAFADLPHVLWCTLVDELVQERALLRNGPWLSLPEHTVTLSDSDRALAQQLQPLIAVGLDPPWVRDLAAVVHQPEERVRQVLRKQVAQGTVYQVVRDLFYDKERIDELADLMASLAREHGAVNAARYRDAIGLGRKRTIQILEFFDRIGYTRRVHDVHVLRTDSGWRHPT
jgi:selenocysteine-specific elongation factor